MKNILRVAPCPNCHLIFSNRILLLLHSPISSHANFTVFASKSVPRFSHLKFRYLRTPLQRKYQSAHAQKNLSITTKLHTVFFFTERDVILLVFRFLDTESLQDIPDAEDKRQKTDVPALNSQQNNKQNFYNAHGAEYIANVC